MQAHADHQIIESLRVGDFSILKRVYEEHAPVIRSWVVKNNGHEEDAQDVFQEAIIALHQKANDHSFVLTCPLGALIFRICRNKWLNQLRKKNREAEVRNWEEEYYIDIKHPDYQTDEDFYDSQKPFSSKKYREIVKSLVA